MKFDMHCHTHEGSSDSKVSVEEYIKLLRDQGFNGMLMTDHNSYNGYRYWKENICGKKYQDFVVLKAQNMILLMQGISLLSFHQMMNQY